MDYRKHSVIQVFSQAIKLRKLSDAFVKALNSSIMGYLPMVENSGDPQRTEYTVRP